MADNNKSKANDYKSDAPVNSNSKLFHNPEYWAMLERQAAERDTLNDYGLNGHVPNINAKNAARKVSRSETERYFSIDDEGHVSAMPKDMPSDFTDYIRDTGDYKINGPDAERPSYEDWKKGKDPDWKPEDERVELPQEILDALNESAEEAGLEKPYRITIHEEDNPGLFHKIDEAFEDWQETDGIKIKAPFGKTDKPVSGLPTHTPITLPNGISLDPDSLPHKVPDGMFDPSRYGIGNDPGFLHTSEPGGVLKPAGPIVSAALFGKDIQAGPTEFLPIDDVTPVTSSVNPKFFESFNDKIADLDLDAVFSKEDSPSLTLLIADDAEASAEQYGETSPRVSREEPDRQSEAEAPAKDDGGFDYC